MSQYNSSAIVLAAGKGTRMKSGLHKVLHAIGGRPMVLHLMDRLDRMGVERRVLVVGAGREQVEGAVEGASFVLQEPQLGTGHAVMMAKDALAGVSGDVLILYGDVPLIHQSTLENMITIRRDNNAALTVLGFEAEDPAHYGRLKLADDGTLQAIVEFKDASDDERAITLCNSGVMCVDGALLFHFLDKIDNDNAAGEYYLTDIVAIARAEGHKAYVVKGTEAEVMGVNSREELAMAESHFQNAKRKAFMDAGVTLTAPETVFFAHDTMIEADVMIEPHVVLGEGVEIKSGARIRSFSHLENCLVGPNCEVGPYARLRPGAELKDGAKVGNFVEVKKSVIDEGAKVNHFTYIGDAHIGAKANIGAGTITCNYDGFSKHKTVIGKGAFIGSNSSLVAPVKIGDGAIVAAGSTISKDVEADALAIERAPQEQRQGWAAKFRKLRKKK